MTLADEIAHDTETFDEVETLTVSQNRAGTVTSASVDNCLPTQLTRNEISSLGAFLKNEVRAYSIPAARLSSAGLDGMSVGDFLTDPDSVAYKVTSAQRMSLSARWRVVATVKRTEA